ncbi:MAG TPA: urease accessory protein [Gammaproteobacteria bacterium]|nr:urease accessory protein [Gammaproteobacteria bacterium]
MTVDQAVPSTGWQARLQLGFQRREQRTILRQCTHQGPLQVQRPFYPEGEAVCHVAILHPPGGVVGGDELRLDTQLDTGAHALLTTPAAGKFYRSAGPLALQTQRLTVAPGAVLEWLPQENIVYNGARLQTLTRVDLQGDARVLGWEILCLGRPAAGEKFTTGECRQTLELWRDGEPLYLETGRLIGGDPVFNAAWGLQGQPVTATLLGAPILPGMVDALREQWNALTVGDDEIVAVTAIDGVLIGRYLGPSAARARHGFILAWSLLRPLLLNRQPCPSRFWNT